MCGLIRQAKRSKKLPIFSKCALNHKTSSENGENKWYKVL